MSKSPEQGINTEYTYRSARPEDVEDIIDLVDKAQEARTGETEGSPDNARIQRNKELIGEPATWSRLVFDGDKLVGCVMGYPAKSLHDAELIPDREHLDSLFVDPEYWGRGIGGGLIDWTHDELSHRGVSAIDLWTETSNMRSRSLYEKKGYSTTGEERIHPRSREPQVQYIVELT